jgi:NADH-ubiquinone oxidoreductase chain 3
MVFTRATQMVQKKIMPRKEKWNQFECGFSNINPSHLPFSFQFFLIAILFLIFDVEISIVLSYPIERQSIKTSMVIFSFLLILTLGLIYEWQKRKIDWSKWMR